MEPILICPPASPELSRLTEWRPLAILPALGRTILEYWISHFAGTGAKIIKLIVSPSERSVLEVAGTGERWGVTLKSAFGEAMTATKGFENGQIAILDRFPAPSNARPITNYQIWFESLIEWMPSARTPDRVGMRENSPGIWVHRTARIGAKVELEPPCWIDANACIGARSLIGPNAIVETGAYIEPSAKVSHSQIGPYTFVGKYAEVYGSIALGSTLIDWRGGMAIKIEDPILLCSLRLPKRTFVKSPFIAEAAVLEGKSQNVSRSSG